MINVRVQEHGGKGALWFIGWMFTIGFAGLSFGQGVLAIVVWPYYLGLAIKAIVR
jgi:hypothetical protein